MKKLDVESIDNLLEIREEYGNCEHRKRAYSIMGCDNHQSCYFKALQESHDGPPVKRCVYWEWYMAKYSQLKKETDN